MTTKSYEVSSADIHSEGLSMKLAFHLPTQVSVLPTHILDQFSIRKSKV